MKTQRFIILNGLVILFFMFTGFRGASVLQVQDTFTIVAVYDGHEDYGYNFIATHDDDEEYTITFQEVSEEVSKAFDLDSDTLINKKFKITYTAETETTIDDDGNEDEEEVLTIVKLEKL